MSFAYLIQMFEKASKELAEDSRRFHVVPLAAIGVPLILLAAYFAFPVLEENWNFGYPTFRLACSIAFSLAGLGLLAWLVEGSFRGPVLAWAYIPIFILEIVTSFAFRLFGDFYWAFERGYFLD